MRIFIASIIAMLLLSATASAESSAIGYQLELDSRAGKAQLSFHEELEKPMAFLHLRVDKTLPNDMFTLVLWINDTELAFPMERYEFGDESHELICSIDPKEIQPIVDMIHTSTVVRVALYGDDTHDKIWVRQDPWLHMTQYQN